MTQNDWLLLHFRKGKTITTLKAYREGICRLSERVRELQQAGHKIRIERIGVKSRWGRKVKVARYGF
jgi:hypothetical protein